MDVARQRVGRDVLQRFFHSLSAEGSQQRFFHFLPSATRMLRSIPTRRLCARASTKPALTYYSAWFCPFAQRAWIALEEKAVAYEYIETTLYEGDASSKIACFW